MALAATVATTEVFEGFLSDDPAFALMHGPTFMANPLACAAANASLDLFETEPRLVQVAHMAQRLEEGLSPCRSLPGVVDVRVIGGVGVVQLARAPDREALKRAFLDRGVWVRPFGDIVYLTPAFILGDDDIAQLTGAVAEVVGFNIP
jgi:adenosylmethionine-8-amino-7-oxononanoate aminotransferase